MRCFSSITSRPPPTLGSVNKFFASQHICGKRPSIPPTIRQPITSQIRPTSTKTPPQKTEADIPKKFRIDADGKLIIPAVQDVSLDEGIHSNLRWKEQPDFTPAVYKDLSKAKLSAFVVLTAMAGYALAPGAVSVATLLWTTAGTALCSGAANAINQWIEAPYDAQMSRTRNRALVRHAISPLHAFSVGIGSGLSGVAMLAYFVNPITAALGAANIILYTCVYTPMKRTSIANTWVGALVGAIPPMMGWVACTGTLDAGAWLMGGILYAWQFPHFNSLAWNLRPDYSKAGYRMMAVTDPALNARVSLRHSLALFPLCLLAPQLGLTTWWFALDSSIVNGVMAYGAWKFWRNSTDKTARSLFFQSLVHLPVLMALLMIHKNASDDDEESKGISISRLWTLINGTLHPATSEVPHQ
ncbi:UbiA prenyltransferase family-domain-containing protein [Phlyctochytrium arcticum]|nr:UbiA prenyltransferase family-domain-containing protein [Phlyctochytrium arcticum]